MKQVTLIFTLILLVGTIALAQDSSYLNADVVELPPEWLVNLLQMLNGLPVVGPYLTVAVQWLGVIVTVLTSFTAAMLVSVRAISSILNVAGLVSFADKLKAFEKGKILYWMKYFSMFNAPKQVVSK